MLVDTHCHLDFHQFDEDRAAVVERAVAAGVKKIIIPAVDMATIPTILSLVESSEHLYAAVGFIPNSTVGLPADWLERLEDYGRHDKVIAVGEIGLDYHWDRSPRDVQHRALAAQLELAFELALPVILHNRDASADLLAILKASPLQAIETPGVFHSFLADWDTAVDAVDLGYFLGFTGPITYKKNDELREIVRQVPLDRILVETDGPYLPPQAYRGKRNEPAFVREIADFIAELRGLPPAQLANMTTENAACLFGRDVIYR